jgi:hypothetical protein
MADATPINADAPKLLLGSLLRGWTPAPYRIAKPEQLHWGETDETGRLTRVRRSGDAIEFAFRDDTGNANVLGYSADAFQRRPVTARYPDGTALSARLSFVTEAGFRTTLEGSFASFTVRAFDWEIYPADGREMFWVSETKLRTSDIADLGNLSLRVRAGMSYAHVEVTDQETFWLIRSEGAPARIWLVVATQGRAIDRERLTAQLLDLGFCLGRSVGVSALTAVDRRLQTIGACVLPVPPHSEATLGSPPVRANLAAALFSWIGSKRDSDEYPAVHTAIAKYLYSAETSEIETRYYHLATAIVRLAAASLRQRNLPFPDSSVAEQDAWRAWVDQNAAQLRALTNPLSPVSLDQHLKVAPPLPVDLLVRYAAANLNVGISNEVTHQLHFLANRLIQDGVGNTRSFLHGIDTLRMFLATLICASLEFHPRSNGVVAEGVTIDVSEADEAMRINWPQFSRLILPNDPLVLELARFAGKLEDSTGGDVIGRLQPVPGAPQGKHLLDMKLLLAQHPEKQVVLFSAVFDDGRLEIIGWDDEPRTVSSALELTEFMTEVSTSAVVVDRVTKLLALGDELRIANRL